MSRLIASPTTRSDRHIEDQDTGCLVLPAGHLRDMQPSMTAHCVTATAYRPLSLRTGSSCRTVWKHSNHKVGGNPQTQFPGTAQRLFHASTPVPNLHNSRVRSCPRSHLSTIGTVPSLGSSSQAAATHPMRSQSNVKAWSKQHRQSVISSCAGTRVSNGSVPCVP